MVGSFSTKRLRSSVRKLTQNNIKQHLKDYIPATATQNYFNRDCIGDYFKYRTVTKSSNKTIHTVRSKIDNDKSNPLSSKTKPVHLKKTMTSVVLNSGIQFEKDIVQKITERLNDQLSTEDVHVHEVCTDFRQSRSREMVDKTLKLMKEQVPVIHSGVVCSDTHELFGIPDLLVRSDILKYIIDTKPPMDFTTQSTQTHMLYVVVDIKAAMLPLSADGIHVTNGGMFRAYKSQLLTYLDCLNEMQNTKYTKAYLLGKGWKTTKSKVSNPFSTLGTVDYSSKDITSKVEQQPALDWVRMCKANVDKWDLSSTPLPHPLLYPNMKNKYDFKFSDQKRKLASKIKDVTMLWNIGTKEREKLHKLGEYSWDIVSSSGLKTVFKNPLKIKKISRMVKVNRGDSSFLPKKLSSDPLLMPVKTEYYIDFETIPSIVSGQPEFVFMIGIGKLKNRKWSFETLVADSLTEDSEKHILFQLQDIVGDNRCIHWGNAEKRIWDTSKQKYNLKNIEWVDLLQLFSTQSIAIQGAFDYGLKSIAKAMKELEYIKQGWDTCCQSGDAAGIIASEYYSGTSGSQSMGDLKEYNKVDVVVMYQILKYLRNKRY